MQGSGVLIADRKEQVGHAATEELLTVTEEHGMVDIDLRYMEPTQESSLTPLARSFCTLPARVMDEIAREWVKAHPTS